MEKLILIVGLLFTGQLAIASKTSTEDYIEMWKITAIEQMNEHGIPASITLAQGILESGNGNSKLATTANNHFGIKCHKHWDGDRFYQDDDKKNECFRSYSNAAQSYDDHSAFLTGRDRYSSLFDLKLTDYKGWAKGLKKAGYATNPKYADLLIKLIEDNNLHQYDKLNKIPEPKVVEKVVERSKPINNTPRVMAVPQIQVSDNNIKYVRAVNGDTPESIAQRNNMGLWQILKYNDLESNIRLMDGEIIYLQPKRNHSPAETHLVKQGETLYSISQKYGVKIKKLRKYNDLAEGEDPQVGVRISLR